MYNRLYELLESKYLIYDLQFAFRQKHSTSHALIHLTDKIQEQLNKGNLGCGIFADFLKAFDTVHHNILIQKLNCYVDKTEVVLLKSLKKQTDSDLHVKLNGK